MIPLLCSLKSNHAVILPTTTAEAALRAAWADCAVREGSLAPFPAPSVAALVAPSCPGAMDARTGRPLLAVRPGAAGPSGLWVQLSLYELLGCERPGPPP
jgi:hypothetical protein